MKHNECIIMVSDLIASQVDLSMARLSNEFYYSSVGFCVFDAVFSINSKYDSTKNVLANNYYGNRQRTSSRNGILKAQAVHEFLEVLEQFDVDGFFDLKKIKGAVREFEVL